MLTESQAYDVLLELIRQPNTKITEVADAWSAIILAGQSMFAPPLEPAPKKRRRPRNPNVGWPKGVKREEYKDWKMAQEAKGVTTNLNPQEYKRLRDAGEVS